MIYVRSGDAWVETADADIPPAIMAVLKADSTHKNLKIHFPNGEIPDFDNSFIVRESLRFTESICSQNTFKFGLAEASVLEFETVGVGNMRGMIIEANLFYGPDANPVAYVPLGVFTVESCPRDGSVLRKRRVTALSPGGGKLEDSPLEIIKLAQPVPDTGGNYYAPDLGRLIQSAIGWHAPGYLSQFPKESMSVTPTATETDVTKFTRTVTMRDGRGMTLTVSVNFDRMVLSSAKGFNTWDLFSLGRDDAAQAQKALADIAAAAIRAETDLPEAEVAKISRDIYRAVSCSYYHNGYKFTGGLPTIYLKSQGQLPQVEITTAAKLKIVRGSYAGEYTADIPATYTFYKLDAPASGLTGRFSPTGTYTSAGGAQYVTFIDCYNFSDICVGYFEAAGRFLRRTRDGGIEVYGVGDDSATPVFPIETHQLWYDEAELADIGTVLVTAPENGSSSIREIVLGTGNAVYDMTDNAFFAAIDGANYDLISAIVQNQFAPAVNGILLRRVELDMIGLPHIQAGASLAVQTADGEVVSLFVLRRDMSGVQRLTDSITSPSFEGE